MSTDYRAELQRLVKAYDEHGGRWPDEDVQALHNAVKAARTTLAQPEPEGVIAPSNRPIISAPKLSIFAVNRPTIEPVPVSKAEIDELTWQHCSDLGDLRIGIAPEDVPALVAAVLARWAAPAIEPAPVAERFEFSVFNSEYEEQAGGAAPTYAEALSYGQHYLSQYSQDGPHSLEIRRVEVLPHHALPIFTP
jgi:hypothetical protein